MTKRCFILASLCSLYIVSGYATEAHNNKAFSGSEYSAQLLLAGGALSTCSSFSKQNCKGISFPDDAKVEILYELNEVSLIRLEKFMEVSAVEKVSASLAPLLNKMKAYSEDKPLSREQLFALFKQAKIEDDVNKLSDSAYFALLDHLEFAQINSNGSRKKEVADVPATINQHSLEIYTRFANEVKLRATAQGQQAHILVASSSSRDAFEVADFYQSVFSSLGVKTTWLPVDQSLVYAIEHSTEAANSCDELALIRQRFELFDRERIYPDRTAQQSLVCNNPEQLTALVASSQGIFFNGGDQSKTRASLFDSSGQPMEYWQAIKSKVERYEMIVGGTSAGTAVHAGQGLAGLPIAMISNGSSEFALKRGVFPALAPSTRCEIDACTNTLFADDVTYMPTGGSGLFGLGTLDTHFSERDREGRLIALALETQAPLSAGVDETTALLYGFNNGTANFEVIGEQGVFLVNGRSQAIQKSLQNNVRQTQYAGYSHYLYSGTQATFDVNTQNWQINEGARLLNERAALPEGDAGVWRNSTRRFCGSREMTSWELDGVNYVIAPEPATQFFTDNKRKHCGYLYLPFVVSANYELNANSNRP